VKAGLFREDLYFYINVVSLRTPAAERTALGISCRCRNHFVAIYSARCNGEVTGINPKAAAAFDELRLAGNVRELQNALERAVVMGKTDLILPEDLPEGAAGIGRCKVEAADGILQAAIVEAEAQSCERFSGRRRAEISRRRRSC